MATKLNDPGGSVHLLPLLRKDVASNGPAWLPLVLVLGAMAAVAYADHRVGSISLLYLYILPLGVGAMFLRREISSSLIAVCILFPLLDSPRNINLGLRIFHNFSAMLCFIFVVYFIQRYVEQREVLAKTVERQRDNFFRMWIWPRKSSAVSYPGQTAIAGLQIAGMMQPVRGVGGDY